METDIKSVKKELRRKISALKKSVPMEEKLILSERIMSLLEHVPGFMEASSVLLYYALPDEVQTEAFIRKWHGRKRIVLPVVCGDDLELRLYDPEKVVPGYMGIPEPSADALPVSPEEIDFAVIPGVAFDARANRMGRGKGFYDRTIPKLDCPRIGVAYSFQIVDAVPVEEFDKPLDGVVTDTGLYQSLQ